MCLLIKYRATASSQLTRRHCLSGSVQTGEKSIKQQLVFWSALASEWLLHMHHITTQFTVLDLCCMSYPLS